MDAVTGLFDLDITGTDSTSTVQVRTVAGSGIGLASFLYVRRPELPARIAESLATFYRLLVNKYYVDEIYEAVIVRPTVRISDKLLFRAVDVGLIDGLGINGTARLVRGLAANGLKYVQTGFTQSYVFLMLAGTVAIIGYLLR